MPAEPGLWAALTQSACPFPVPFIAASRFLSAALQLRHYEELAPAFGRIAVDRGRVDKAAMGIAPVLPADHGSVTKALAGRHHPRCGNRGTDGWCKHEVAFGNILPK